MATGLQLACARERLRLEVANREAAERRLATAQALLARLLPACRPHASQLCGQLEGDEKVMLDGLLAATPEPAPYDGDASATPQSQLQLCGKCMQQTTDERLARDTLNRPSEQQRQQSKDSSFTSDEWNSCLKVLRLISSHTRLFADHIAQLTFAKRVFLHMFEMEQPRDLALVPKAGGFNRQLDMALMRSTELRKRYTEDMERLKRQLPTAFEYGNSAAAAAIEWISEVEVDCPQVICVSTLDEQEATGETGALGLDSTDQFFEVERTTAVVCIICRQSYRRVHKFYGEKFCPECSQLNWDKRNATADLTGRVALVTGGRIKIGLETALILLRCGAIVYVTTRFPKDAAQRYSQETDFDQWKDRLHILTADFRDIRVVEALVQYLSSHLPRLDIIINNAAQTIARPAHYYKYLRPTEDQSDLFLPPQQQSLIANQWNKGRLASASAVAWTREAEAADAVATTLTPKPTAMDEGDVEREGGDESVRVSDRDFPPGVFTSEGEQIDLRTKNSWSLYLDEVSTREFLEVQAVNAIAPFLINGRLRALMKQSPPLPDGSRAKFIINVSAMEGQFYRFKTDRHPHTNMAKAALNMMTRTSGPDYAVDDIYMNSVDTGWVTDENPWPVRLETGFCPPLDCKDGAARVVDPILTAVRGEVSEPAFGSFFKDYKITHW